MLVEDSMIKNVYCSKNKDIEFNSSYKRDKMRFSTYSILFIVVCLFVLLLVL